MARPNRIPVIVISGRKLITGAEAGRSTVVARCPSWKIQTTMPSATPMVRRKPRTAVSGTSNERKTSMRMMAAMPTTTSRYTGSAAPSLAETSMASARGSRHEHVHAEGGGHGCGLLPDGGDDYLVATESGPGWG